MQPIWLASVSAITQLTSATKGILPGRIWGDGSPEGVRQRAAEEIINTAHAARLFGVDTVTGFTGSSIWLALAMFPPVPPQMIEDGYKDFR